MKKNEKGFLTQGCSFRVSMGIFGSNILFSFENNLWYITELMQNLLILISPFKIKQKKTSKKFMRARSDVPYIVGAGFPFLFCWGT